MSTSPESPPVPMSVPGPMDPTAETTSARPDEGTAPTPTGSEPAASEPAGSGPAAHEPASYEPASYEPAAYEPAAYAPAASGPAASGPAASGRAVGSPSGSTADAPNAWEPTAPFAPPPTAGPYPPAPEWYPYPPEPNLRMRRSATDKMLAGVCGGIAEHTDIDPVYIRLAFLISLLWGGIGFFVYVVAAVLIPKPLPTTP